MLSFRKIKIIFVSSAALCLLGCAQSPAPPAHPIRGIGQLLQEYKYTALQPPSTLTPPGTLVAISSDDPLVLGVVCRKDSALSVSAQPQTSNSANSNEIRDFTGSFNLDASYIDRINAHLGANYVKSISVALSNVKVREIADDTVIENARSRTPACTQAVALRRATGRKVTMIKSVLEADAVYSVTFNATVSGGVKAQITPQLSSALNAAASSTGSDRFDGSALFWGIRDDRLLADAGTGSGLPPTGAPRERAAPIGKLAEVKDESGQE